MKHRRATVLMMYAAAIFILMGMHFAHGFAAGEGLKVTPGQFDFGTVDEGKAAVVTVTVENAGSTRIEITNVRTS